MFFTFFGHWARGAGGTRKGLVHNQLLQFLTLRSSKTEISETYFFDVVVPYNDHPRY